MSPDSVMGFTLTIRCMKHPVSITYPIERVARTGRLALLLNKTGICSFFGPLIHGLCESCFDNDFKKKI